MKKLKDNIEIVGVFVLLVTAIGGFIFWAGEPPYANEERTYTKIEKLQIQVSESKLDNLHRQIFELEAEKLKFKDNGRAWPMKFEGELQRLMRVRVREEKKIDKLIDEGDK